MTTAATVPAIIPHEHPFRWAMLGGVWLIYFSFGLLAASMPPLIAPISADLALSNTAIGSILGAWPLVYIVVAIPCGVFVDRAGLKWALFLAAILMAASGALRAVAPGYITMFLAVGIFGVGGPLISIGAPKAIAQWFAGRERGIAIGIYITGPSLGSVLALSLTNSVLMPVVDNDWRAALMVYAVIILIAGFSWFALAMNPINRSVEAATKKGGTMGDQLAVFGALLRIRSVWLVLAMSIGIFFFFHGMGNWLPELLRQGGMAPAEAGLWASVPVAVGIIGSLTVPRFATPHRRFAVLLVLFASIGVGAVLLFNGQTPSIVASLIVQGLGRGSLMAIALLVLMETRGVDAGDMGAAGGLFFSAAEIGGVLGPLSIGVVVDVTGGFNGALWMMIAVSGALVLLLFSHRSAERRASSLGGDTSPTSKNSGS